MTKYLNKNCFTVIRERGNIYFFKIAFQEGRYFFTDYEVNLCGKYVPVKSGYYFIKGLLIIARVFKIEVRLERV